MTLPLWFVFDSVTPSALWFGPYPPRMASCEVQMPFLIRLYRVM